MPARPIHTSARKDRACASPESSSAITTLITLLRAVNLGRHKTLAMSDVRDFLSDLGFEDVRSVLQSGNLVFRSAGHMGSDLERLLEAEAEKRLNLQTDFYVRTAEQWRAVVARNPFPTEAERDPAHLVVMFFKGPPDQKDVKALQAAITGPEIIRADGKHAYIVYPAGIGRSRLTVDLIERKLRTSGTGRNWNTVLKLAAHVG